MHVEVKSAWSLLQYHNSMKKYVLIIQEILRRNYKGKFENDGHVLRKERGERGLSNLGRWLSGERLARILWGAATKSRMDKLAEEDVQIVDAYPNDTCFWS